jgi:hypothetical protein
VSSGVGSKEISGLGSTESNGDVGSKVPVGSNVNEGVGSNDDGMNVGARVLGEGFLVGLVGLRVGPGRGNGARVGLLTGVGLPGGVGVFIGFLYVR